MISWKRCDDVNSVSNFDLAGSTTKSWAETDDCVHGVLKDEASEALPEKLVVELLIATERRLFIVSSSVDGEPVQTVDPDFWALSDDLEIVDSIPLEEVESIRMGQPGNWGGDLSYARKGDSGFLQRCSGPLAKLLFEEKKDVADSVLDTESERKMLGCCSHDGELESFLKITTKSLHGFNRGRPYYFTIIKDSFRSLKRPAGQNDGDTLEGQDDTQKKVLERVCRELDSLADRRRTTFKREHRFQLFQEKLQAVWDSLAFNICVLILISSNFIFTVMQLENKDPARQSFYEAVDLSYTIIFTAGLSPTPPGQRQLHALSISLRYPLNPGPLHFARKFPFSLTFCKQATNDFTRCDTPAAYAAHRRARACPELPRACALAFPKR
jgi:hypothetical protein